MNALSVQDMIANIRDLADDEEEHTHTDAELVGYVNGAVGYYDALLAVHAKSVLMQYRDIAHDGSELQAVTPYLPRIVSVERTTQTPRIETAPLEGGFRDRFPLIRASAGTTLGSYYLQNNQLAVVPQQASGATDRVWFVLRTPELHYGTADASSTTTSFIFAATPTAGNVVQMNDAYNMIPVMLTTTREVNVIDDFTGSTRTSTLLFTFQNAPASQAYSVLPVIAPEFHWLFVWQALIIGKIRTEENKIDAVSERTRLENLLLQSIRTNTVQRNKYMRRMGWG